MSRFQSRWSRRRVLAAALAAAPLLAACGSAPAPTSAPAVQTPAGAPAAGAKPSDTAKPAESGAPAAAKPATGAGPREVPIVFAGWILDQNPIITKLVERYNGENSAVKIVLSSAPDDLKQKMLLEAQQGKSTWAGWEGHTAFLDTAPLVEADVLAPIDDAVPKDDFGDMVASSIDESKYKGKMYHYPMRVSPIAMGYRPTLLKQLGYEKLPDSWDGIIELAAKAQKDMSKPDKKMFGIVFHTPAWRSVWPVNATLNPKPYRDGRADMDAPSMTKSFEIVKKLFSYSAPDIFNFDAMQNIFRAGQSPLIMLYVLGIWGNKKPLNGDVAIGRMPRTPEAEGTVYWSSGGNAIKRHPTSADTIPFYSWLSKQKELWDSMWVQQGVPPNRRSMFKLYDPLKGNDLDAGYWQTQEMQEKSVGIPNSLDVPIQAKHTEKNLQDFLLDKIKLDQAIANIKKDTDDEIKKQTK
jgi:ABC-type glycerol-3-phosphate transport system substrate-binding protein